jgi:predicted secreted protein
MSTFTAVATFFLIWWVTLFAVLPWGVRSQHEGEDLVPGTDPGAPMRFRLGWKLLWTTLAAAVIYGALAVVYIEHLITIDGLMAPFVGTKNQ